MATESRHSPTALADRLLADGCGFELFQAVRLLLRDRPARVAPGSHGLPADEAARFLGSSALTFPASVIESIREAPPEDGVERDDRPLHVVVAALGLTGYAGVLPWFYSEMAARPDGAAFAAFLDLFNHRLISLDYRAWEKGRPLVAGERAAVDAERPLATQVGALLGLQLPTLRDRLELPTDALRAAVADLTPTTRSATALAALLAARLSARVEVEEFVGRWVDLDTGDAARLGSAANPLVLGGGSLLGRRVWYQQASFRVRVQGLSFEAYRGLLPGGQRFAEVLEWVSQFTGGVYEEFEIELELDATAPAGNRLGGKGTDAPRLGWFGWFGDVAGPGPSTRAVVFRSTETLAELRRCTHRALVSIRAVLRSERRTDLVWSEAAIQCLLELHRHESGSRPEIEAALRRRIRPLVDDAIAAAAGRASRLWVTTSEGALVCGAVEPVGVPR